MPPAGRAQPKASSRGRSAAAKAKAAAQAKQAAKNAKRSCRRTAVAALNSLAADVGAARVALAPKQATADAVKRLVMRLQPRCHDGDLFGRLRAATQLYVDGGGQLELEPAPDLDTASHVQRHRVLKPEFRLHSSAFMLTYNSPNLQVGDWPAFRSFIVGLKGKMAVRAWAACLEQSLHASDETINRHHCHAYLMWTDGVGICRDSLADFVFRGIRPRVDVCTVQKQRGQELNPAALHGLWYVSLMKAGTVCAETNFSPGKWYKPKAQWLESLYQDGKVSRDRFVELSATTFPVGHAARKRDVDEALRDAKRVAVMRLVRDQLAELEETDALTPLDLARYPDVETFVASFRQAERRRPVVVLVGATGVGKSLLAAQILMKMGETLGLKEYLEVTVEDDGHMDFSDLDPEKHAGVLLDGLGDVELLKKNRESLQGRPKELKGARSQTMRFAYPYTLARRAVVLTLDLSAANIHMLTSDHWLSEKKNVLVVRLEGPAWQPGAASAPSPRDMMARWSVADLAGFLKGHDLEGPAATLVANGVRGEDFLQLAATDLAEDFGLSAFATRRVLAARGSWLEA